MGPAKTRTAVLYRGDEPVEFGNKAFSAYSSMVDDGNTEGLALVEWFKLSLAPDGYLVDARRQGRQLEAVLPPGVTALQVTAHYLGWMRSKAHAFLENTVGKDYDRRNVLWCLTVPAAWDDKGKYLMRTAACAAGMIPTIDAPNLLITYEPEAAALHALRHGTTRLQHGDTFMTVDAGGGTVDITVHTVVDDSTSLPMPMLVEEVPGGATLTGGTFVDSRWEAAFCRDKLRSCSSSDTCADELREGMLEQRKRWGYLKRKYDPQQRPEKGWAMEVSSLLPVQEAGRRARKLTYSNADMDGFFAPALQQVDELVAQKLGQLGSTVCDKLLLVGGFGGSKALVQHLRQRFAGRGVGEVLVPESAELVVVKGAVIYGTQPELIRARRCRLWYGIGSTRAYDRELHAGTMPLYDTASGQLRVNHFSELVAQGELLLAGEARGGAFLPLHEELDSVLLELFATAEPCTREDGGARLTTDAGMRRIASLEVDLGPLIRQGVPVGGRRVLVQLQFGRTELQFTAAVPGTGQVLSTAVQYA